MALLACRAPHLLWLDETALLVHGDQDHRQEHIAIGAEVVVRTFPP
jgi:hypothetical protein